MTTTGKKTPEIFSGVDWNDVSSHMHTNGYAVISRVFNFEHCDEFIDGYDQALYRKTVIMERHRFGLGEYKYFDYPLPGIVQTARDAIYPNLAPIANKWSEQLNVGIRYPPTFGEFQNECHKNAQMRPTPLILKYGEGGFNTLHQDLYGEVYFPMQAAIFLNEPDVDYTGGEFVLTQQTPRAQSKAIVLRPRKGDMIIFTTNFRPVNGSRGAYRVNIKHGVSEVRSGVRHTLGIIFHDAIS